MPDFFAGHGRWERVTIQSPDTATRDSRFNTPSGSWTDMAEVWAKVQDYVPSRGSRDERVVEGLDIASRPCRVRLRWRSDVTAAMRVKIRGIVNEIVAGPAELGRREAIELVCQELTTMGAQR